MRLTHSNFQLEGYYVKSLQYSVRTELEDSSKLALTSGLHIQPFKPMAGHTLTPQCEIEGSQHVKDESRFRIALTVSSGKGEEDLPPYVFEVTLIGFFKIVGLTPTPAVKGFVLNNAATILYSSARELIASATGRGPFPALVLPTVTFIPESTAVTTKAVRKLTARQGAAKKTRRAKLPVARKK
jgi:preprotein translocase subunit SecB